MSNLSVENIYTRQEAKELGKKHLWKLVGMLAIVYGVGFGLTFLGEMLLAGQATVLSNGQTEVSPVYAICSLLLSLAASLVGGGLSLGMTAGMLAICRRQETTVNVVFSRMGQCLKMFGLTLWVGLKTALWALPGGALIVAGFTTMVVTMQSQTAVTNENAAVAMLIVMAGYVVLFVLMIPAAFRYLMAPYVLADEPDRGVRECVTLSKTMMKGHKWQAFKLIVPFILVLYAVMLVVMLPITFVAESLPSNPAVMLIMTILPIVIMLVGVIYLGLRAGLSYCLFYLKRRYTTDPAQQTDTAMEVLAEAPAEAADEAPASDPAE